MSRPEIAVTTLGGTPGRPVLVLGPSLGTRVDRLWTSVAAQVGDLHVLGWDLPGHGRSPASSAGFGIDDLAESVLAAVDDVVGVPATRTPYLYAGDSVGGAVGLQLVLEHRERFRAAAVLCSAARFGTPEAWSERAALVRAEGMAPLVATAPDRWFGSRQRSGQGTEVRSALEDLAAVDPESYAQVCEAIGAFDVTGRLGEVSTPLLAVAGADDVVTPPAGHQDLVGRVCAGRFAVLRGVGHLAPLEDAKRTAALLREHFARVVAPAA